MKGPGDSLRSRLTYEPRELQFGTSGRRGEVAHLTQLEIYITVSAELHYLQSLPAAEGGIAPGDQLYFASDLRPSSTSFVEAQQGRGEICQTVVTAALDCGMHPVNLGQIPTPALAFYAFANKRASVMVTGSHIPFDRNGYKLNTSRGELLKHHEAPIAAFVRRVRQQLYEQPFTESLFNEHGMFKAGHIPLPSEQDAARLAYFRRYADFFHGSSLNGKRIAVYQHSAVGRDLLVDILAAFGADVVAMGRSETFVPIDTENMDAFQLASIQAFTRETVSACGPVWAVVSTDGDSDRPLVLGVSPDSSVHFFAGDLVGMVVSEFLGADAVVVPISCNDAIDRGSLRSALEPKTKIGSPYVIEGLENARKKGRSAVCGWEANGGFLTGSDIERNGRVLTRLATRDAVLPILSVLLAARQEGVSLGDLFSRLPPRYSRAALLRNFPRAISREIIGRFSPGPDLQEAVFLPVPRLVDCDGHEITPSPALQSRLDTIRNELRGCFPPELGFTQISRLNYVDGVRIVFSNGDVAHVRPSGNADELRIYAVADTQPRADTIAQLAIVEPAGILRSMERLVSQSARAPS